MNLKSRALLVRPTKRQSVRGSDYHSIPMNKQAAIAAVIALTSILGACEAPQPVDLILTDARVYTAERGDSLPSTLVIDNGRILAVGDASLLERFEGPTRALSGRLVLPGFHDAHTHLIYGGRQLMQCDLSGLVSMWPFNRN